nr:sterol desaturase family protein [Pedobacter sp. ASV19]
MNHFLDFTNPLKNLFFAPEIALTEISTLEKKAPDIVVYVLPLVLLITIVEFFVSYFLERKNYESKETLGSLFVGAGNLLINLAMKTIMLYGAVWLYNALPYRMAFNWWTLIPCFIIYDFCSYWTHRISHFCRFFWASHVVHHSADHYNLTVNFRQSWFQYTKVIFFIPLLLTGVHPVIFFVANQLSLLYQFWVHTEAIGKLGPLVEKYMGTPSNHRVHHGSQEKYLDKNFGAVFMIWDHLFGTFQYEVEKPKYGITNPLKSKIDPVYLNIHEFQDIITDVRQSHSLGRKLYYIFASPDHIAKRKSGKKAGV